MAGEHLGTTFDIHGGGLDLIFPHHENEIAQSRCAHDGAPLANYWMHNGFLTIDKDKMSKSLGNFFTVRDLLAQAPGEALRLALLTAHYRQPLDFSAGSIEKGQRHARPLVWRVARHSGCRDRTGRHTLRVFEAALLDDLNTPVAIARNSQYGDRA